MSQAETPEDEPREVDEPVGAAPNDPEPPAAEPGKPLAAAEAQSGAGAEALADLETTAAEADPAAAQAAPTPEAAPDVPAEAPDVSSAAAEVAAPAPELPAEQASPAREEYDDYEATPREKPAIPGADLIPDIVSDGDEYLDAEARAAAEADAEARAAAGDDDDEADTQPIANAAIDLAAGARYTATGKRKTAVARVILRPGTGAYLINGRTLDEFFPRNTLQRVIRQPLETVGYESRMDVVARMHGGGVAAQAGALRHGIARALLEADPQLRGELKRRGFLTRDARVKERKKAGLKKARKRPQFSKR